MKKRYIPCNLCGSEKYTVLYEDELKDALPKLDYDFSTATLKTYQIVKCDSCGFIYTNPMPYISSSYEDIVDEVYLKSKKERLTTAEGRIKDILKFKRSGSLLDIGCSIGIFLDVAAKHFYVEGIELSNWAYREAAKRHKVYNKTLSELGIKKTYDIVTLFAVIEHFENPKEELILIYNILKPGGLLVIYTGNVDAWLPRLLKKKWWWFQGMHNLYFSEKTCRLLLEKCNFEVLKVKTDTTFFKLFSLGIALRRYKIGNMINPIFNIPFLKNLEIPVRLSGEMLLFALKTDNNRERLYEK